MHLLPQQTSRTQFVLSGFWVPCKGKVLRWASARRRARSSSAPGCYRAHPIIGSGI